MTPVINVMTSKVVMGDDVEVDSDTVENSETSVSCKCVICEDPEVMVLPKNLKVCNSSFVEDTNHLVSSSVVTICNMEFVDRYFPKEVVYSHSEKVSSSSVKVRKELKERYKIPRLDERLTITGIWKRKPTWKVWFILHQSS